MLEERESLIALNESIKSCNCPSLSYVIESSGSGHSTGEISGKGGGGVSSEKKLSLFGSFINSDVSMKFHSKDGS